MNCFLFLIAIVLPCVACSQFVCFGYNEMFANNITVSAVDTTTGVIGPIGQPVTAAVNLPSNAISFQNTAVTLATTASGDLFVVSTNGNGAHLALPVTGDASVLIGTALVFADAANQNLFVATTNFTGSSSTPYQYALYELTLQPASKSFASRLIVTLPGRATGAFVVSSVLIRILVQSIVKSVVLDVDPVIQKIVAAAASTVPPSADQIVTNS